MHAALILGRSVVAGICGWAAYQLAASGKEGWGWFIFATIVIGAVDLIHAKEAK